MVVCLKSKVQLCEEVGPRIAERMRRALHEILGQPIEVEFAGVQVCEQRSILLEPTEKCFGALAHFTDPAGHIKGVVTVFFPLSSAKALVESLTRRYLGRRRKPIAEPEMKLSAFKEATNILMSTHIGGIAEALNLKLNHSMPRLVHLAHLELPRRRFSEGQLGADEEAVIGQFSIEGTAATTGTEDPRINGRFVIVFS